MRTRLTALPAVATVVGMVLGGCGADDRGPSGRPAATATTALPDGGWILADGDELVWGEPFVERGGATAEERVAGSDESATPATTASGGSGGDVAVEPLPPVTLDPSLRAGSVDDNDRWEDYLLYLQAAQAAAVPHSPIDVSGRRIVQVVDAAGGPVLGASVTITDAGGAEVWHSTTHADGRTLFLAPFGDDQQQPRRYTAIVARDGVETRLELPADQLTHQVVLDVGNATPLAVDVLFLIDTTGSMADEIEQLKANMISVAEQIDALPGDTDVRYAMTVYRDRDDLFVTRSFDFTPDVTDFTAALRDVVADGGGDEPEDLNAGLHEALTAPSWREDTAVQLMFLVADAPPHLGYDGPDYADDALAAVGRGVKVFPVASSGLDAQGEYVFRQLAQVTMGRFVFLTYGADGASPGEARTDLAVDDYSVLALDELVVQLVGEELAHQLG